MRLFTLLRNKIKGGKVMLLLLVVLALVTSTKSKAEMDSYNLPVALVVAGIFDIVLLSVYGIVSMLF